MDVFLLYCIAIVCDVGIFVLQICDRTELNSVMVLLLNASLLGHNTRVYQCFSKDRLSLFACISKRLNLSHTHISRGLISFISVRSIFG